MSKKDDGPKRQMNLTIDEDLWPAFRAYMDSHGIDRPVHAARSLLSEALSATPKDGVIIAAGKRAHTEVMAHLLESTGRFYDQMRIETNEVLRSIAGVKHFCPHCNGNL